MMERSKVQHLAALTFVTKKSCLGDGKSVQEACLYKEHFYLLLFFLEEMKFE